jgi:hypothetical protein
VQVGEVHQRQSLDDYIFMNNEHWKVAGVEDTTAVCCVGVCGGCVSIFVDVAHRDVDLHRRIPLPTPS